MPPIVWQTGVTDTPGTYTAAVTEFLSGRTATFGIVVDPGKPVTVVSSDSSSDVISAVDRRALGHLWHTRGTEWAIALDVASPARAAMAESLAKTLRRRGLTVNMWTNPVTVKMPVGYAFTPEQQQVRERVFAGEVIGDRYYLHGHDGDKQAPYGELWEPRSGLAIYRNLIVLGRPGESALLDKYGPGPGENGAIRVGLRAFAGDYDAVFLAARSDEQLSSLVDHALSVEPDDAMIGPEAGRQAFKAGYLMGTPAREEFSLKAIAAQQGQVPISWAERLGRPVMRIQVAPNGQHILVKHNGKRTLIGEYAPDGKMERALVREIVGDSDNDDVSGIEDDGALVLSATDRTQRVLPLGGGPGSERPTPPIWQSADGQETLAYVPYVAEGKDKDGKPAQVTKQKLTRHSKGQILYESEAMGNATGGLLISPNGRYAWQADDGSPRSQHIAPRTVTMYDAVTGTNLWTKKGWWPSVSAWSRDGECLAVVRHYNNVDRHGLWPEPYTRCTMTMVSAATGEVLAEGYPTTWVDRLAVAADNSFVIGFAAYMAEHYWLLRPPSAAGSDEALRKVEASDRWLYTAMLDGAGRDVVTLDMAGTLRRHKATGEVIWSSDALKRPWGPVLGMLVPLGGDMLLGSTAGRAYRIGCRDGRVLWEATTADGVHAE